MALDPVEWSAAFSLAMCKAGRILLVCGPTQQHCLGACLWGALPPDVDPPPRAGKVALAPCFGVAPPLAVCLVCAICKNMNNLTIYALPLPTTQHNFPTVYILHYPFLP